MNALVLMHVANEPAGTLSEDLAAAGVSVRTVRLYAGEALPGDVAEVDLIVSMGGPLNVYEEDQYPFLAPEVAFLAKGLAADVPMLGVCLGAQMIARAAGARVVRSPEPEVGWGTIRLTEAGAADPLLGDWPKSLRVLQWHDDMFELPAGAALLATADACPNQAFRLGNAYGLQFHVEATCEMAAAWFADTPHYDPVVREFESAGPAIRAAARSMAKAFVALAGQRRR
jgi:GMP synthase (glutamine-hydrolysing)